MRLAIVGIMLALAGVADADDNETVKQFADELAGNHADRAARLLAPRVALDGLWFDGDCKRFAKRQMLADRDRDAFVGCLEQLVPSSTSRHHGVSTGAILMRDGLAFGVVVKDRQVAAIGFVDDDPSDAGAPTVFRAADRIAGRLAVAAATRAAIDKLTSHRVAATFKTCVDARGKITKTRVVAGSRLAEFDAAAKHTIDGYTFAAVELAGRPTAACEVIRFELDTRPTAAPAGATRAINISPTTLEPLRTKGKAAIAPDAATRSALVKAKVTHVSGVWRACFDLHGAFVSAQSIRSTGYPPYDATIENALADWAFRPYAVDGVASPVCIVTTVAYDG